MQPENPHFAFPFQRGQVVEQDTLDHVMGCVELICRCPVGFRIERPDFGIVWHEYRLEVIPQGVMQSALREFEGP
jgi:phage baseplate assembly protein W